jgi:hypothetical protein
MAKELNSAMVVTRVAPTDRNWLDREAERQGLSGSTLVRTMIRRERLASESAEYSEAKWGESKWGEGRCSDRRQVGSVAHDEAAQSPKAAQMANNAGKV